MFGAICGQAKGKKPTTHEEVQELVEVVDGTPLEESLTAEDIVAMYDASPQAPNQTNEEHVLALASVAERINGAARHPETGQFTSPEPTRESKSPKSPHHGLRGHEESQAWQGSCKRLYQLLDSRLRIRSGRRSCIGCEGTSQGCHGS
jgi:hypothetical protein